MSELPWQQRPGPLMNNGAPAYIEFIGFDGTPQKEYVIHDQIYRMDTRGYVLADDAPPEAIAHMYDTWAGAADSYDARSGWTAQIGVKLGRLMNRHGLLPDGPGAVVDICTGTGRVPKGLMQEGVAKDRITGYDISPTMLAIAQADEELTGVRFVEANAEVLPLEPETNDLVVGSLGLHYMRRRFWQKAIDNMVASLTPNGLLVVVGAIARDWRVRSVEFQKFVEQNYNGVTKMETHNFEGNVFQIGYTTVRSDQGKTN